MLGCVCFWTCCRLLIGLEYALLVWWTPSVKQEDGFPVYYYAVVLLSYAVHQVSLLIACVRYCKSAEPNTLDSFHKC